MDTNTIKEMAQICGADPEKMKQDIEKYGVRGFFASVELLGYPESTAKKMKMVHDILRSAEVMEDEV